MFICWHLNYLFDLSFHRINMVVLVNIVPTHGNVLQVLYKVSRNNFRFFKIVLLITSRFLVQSYILSMVVKSLMWKFVSANQYFSETAPDNSLYRELEEKYYRYALKNNFVSSIFCDLFQRDFA